MAKTNNIADPIRRLGPRLKQLRKARQLSQKELGDRVFVSHIENGLRLPSLQTLVKICDALNITLGEFFSFDEPADEREALRQIVSLLRGRSTKNLVGARELLEVYFRKR